MVDAAPPVRRKRRSTVGWVLSILGPIVGAGSLFSFLQRWTGVEIVVDVLAEALSSYRDMAAGFKWALFDWWTPFETPWGWAFSMPMWGMDLLAIWLLWAGTYYRSEYTMRRDQHLLLEYFDGWHSARRGSEPLQPGEMEDLQRIWDEGVERNMRRSYRTAMTVPIVTPAFFIWNAIV